MGQLPGTRARWRAGHHARRPGPAQLLPRASSSSEDCDGWVAWGRCAALAVAELLGSGGRRGELVLLGGETAHALEGGAEREGSRVADLMGDGADRRVGFEQEVGGQ